MCLYINLKDEMRRKKILWQDISRVLKISDITANKKINAQISFTLEEAEIIQSELFPELEITYLFKTKKIN